MPGFIGEYVCKVDIKGRVLFPASLKKQLDSAAEDSFIINRGFEGCLVLYPKNEWDTETAQLKKLNLFIAKNRKFYRQFHNGATALSLDGNNRLLLPKRLMKDAGINNEVILFAYANRIEIWSKQRYEKEMVTNDDDFASLAEDVMGRQNTEKEDQK